MGDPQLPLGMFHSSIGAYPLGAPIMREMVRAAGYDIFQEDTTTMWHSSIMLFRPCG